MSFAATKGSRIFVSLKAVINELPLHEICSWDCTNSGERASPFKSRKDLPILKTPQMLLLFRTTNFPSVFLLLLSVCIWFLKNWSPLARPSV
jgi:hypothetical protein